MKIAITIELDKESAELFQTPFKKLSKQINDLIGMFEKVALIIVSASGVWHLKWLREPTEMMVDLFIKNI